MYGITNDITISRMSEEPSNRLNLLCSLSEYCFLFSSGNALLALELKAFEILSLFCPSFVIAWDFAERMSLAFIAIEMPSIINDNRNKFIL